jgi:hypothetical protein
VIRLPPGRVATVRAIDSVPCFEPQSRRANHGNDVLSEPYCG